jgi:hypothetical protein
MQCASQTRVLYIDPTIVGKKVRAIAAT